LAKVLKKSTLFLKKLIFLITSNYLENAAEPHDGELCSGSSSGGFCGANLAFARPE
jgi:hypothetical protein